MEWWTDVKNLYQKALDLEMKVIVNMGQRLGRSPEQSMRRDAGNVVSDKSFGYAQ